MRYDEFLFRQKQGHECLPAVAVAWISVAMAAASATAGVMAQRQNAKAQEAYQDKMMTSAAKASYGQSFNEQASQAQESEARAAQLEKARQESALAASTANVASGESGMSGLSTDMLLGQYGANLARYTSSVNRQAEISKANSALKLDYIRQNGETTQLQIAQPIQQPNYLAAGLSVASSAVGTYGAYKGGQFGKT